MTYTVEPDVVGGSVSVDADSVSSGVEVLWARLQLVEARVRPIVVVERGSRL
ncbi:hypothetical protein [Streptomyces lacrimifluminis]|uniref:hypothetical protein n=1 Tax=Streptomyces lacrimifluminis TaxID=1500077 RepID=UPI0031EDAAD9